MSALKYRKSTTLRTGKGGIAAVDELYLAQYKKRMVWK